MHYKRPTTDSTHLLPHAAFILAAHHRDLLDDFHLIHCVPEELGYLCHDRSLHRSSLLQIILAGDLRRQTTRSEVLKLVTTTSAATNFLFVCE